MVMVMTVHIYRNLRVWQRARRLALDVYEATSDFPPSERFGLTSQVQRSAVSIASNIAEGAGRDGRSFRQFLNYALGSAAELDTQLEIALGLGFGDEAMLIRLMGDTVSIQKMLWGLIERGRSDS